MCLNMLQTEHQQLTEGRCEAPSQNQYDQLGVPFGKKGKNDPTNFKGPQRQNLEAWSAEPETLAADLPIPGGH